MNFLNKIETIKSKFKKSGYGEIADELLEVQLSGGTGGEVLIAFCAKLLEIRRNRADAFMIVEKEAEELISYSESIGLYPR